MLSERCTNCAEGSSNERALLPSLGAPARAPKLNSFEVCSVSSGRSEEDDDDNDVSSKLSLTCDLMRVVKLLRNEARKLRAVENLVQLCCELSRCRSEPAELEAPKSFDFKISPSRETPTRMQRSVPKGAGSAQRSNRGIKPVSDRTRLFPDRELLLKNGEYSRSE